MFKNIALSSRLSNGAARIQSGDHTEGYEMCGCVCAGGYCGEIRIRVETNTHPYEGKYCLPGGREICVGQYPQYIHYARRPHLFFLRGIKGTLGIIFIIITISLKNNQSIFLHLSHIYANAKILQCSICLGKWSVADNDTKWGSLELL